MVQQVFISLLFVSAAFYLGRLIYKSFQAKNACETGCGKCGAIDAQKIEKELKAKGL
jgi:hypothetical protein